MEADIEHEFFIKRFIVKGNNSCTYLFNEISPSKYKTTKVYRGSTRWQETYLIGFRPIGSNQNNDVDDKVSNRSVS